MVWREGESPMRISKPLIAVAALFALGAGAHLAGALEPSERRPGLWLRGELVQGPVADWTFSDADQLVELETRAPWLLPHSVTVVCASLGGALYVPSVYRPGEGGFPAGRAWNRNVVRDPNVRIRIAGKIYERRALLVTDEAERAAVFAAFAAKYGAWAGWHAQPPGERPEIAFVRLDPRQ
jgi:hypothetical protein